MGRKSSLSSSKDPSLSSDVCCPFEEVRVVEQKFPLPKTYMSPRPKLLDEGCKLQVDNKHIFISSKYKMAWKKIVFLEWQDHDGTNDASLLLSDIPTDEQGQPIGDGKRMEARIGVDYRTGRPPVQAADFRRAVERKWSKILRKQQREEEEALLEEREQARAVAHSKKRPKPKKAALFLSKNAANERAWNDWSDEDDNVFNRKNHKELLDSQKDRRQRQQEEQDQEMEDVAEESDNHASEQEASLSDADEPNEGNDTTMDDAADHNVEPLPKTQNRSTTTKGRRLRRKRIQDADHHDGNSDDELFGDISSAPPVTTPMAQRVVTPGTTFRAGVLEDDDDEEEEEDAGLENFKRTKASTPQKASKPVKSIASFFKAQTPKSRENMPADEKTKEKPAENAKEVAPVEGKVTKTVKQDFFAPRRFTKSIDDYESKDKEAKKGNDDEDDATVSSLPPLEANNEDDTTDEIATPTSRKMDFQTPPRTGVKSTGRKSFGTDSSRRTLATARRLEEDDPIEDFEENENLTSRHFSSIKSPLVGRLSGNKRRSFNPRQRFFGSKPPPRFTSASRALDMADHQSPPHDLYASMDAPSSSLGKKMRTSGSPMSPLRLARPLVSSPVASTTRVATIASTTPTATAPPQKWRGLLNMGNTCYMNASLQMLYSIPSFVEALVPFKNHRLVDMFYQTYRNVLFPKGTIPGAARTSSLKDAIDKKTDRFRGYQQRDAHEFLGELIDQMHEDIEGGSSPNDVTIEEEKKDESAAMDNQNNHDKATPLPTDDYFRLNVEVCLKCKSCGYSRTKEEMYRYLSVDIESLGTDEDGKAPPNVSVEQCLANFFQPEDREIKCEKCKDGTEATQTLRILSRPKALLLHLKRFVLVERQRNDSGDDKENNVEVVFQKNRAPVELTEKLSLDDFMKGADEQELQQLSTSYSVKSIVHHIGSTSNSGHYTADALRCVRTPAGEENDENTTPSGSQWVSYDDGSTTETTLESIRGTASKQRTAYILLYSID